MRLQGSALRLDELVDEGLITLDPVEVIRSDGRSGASGPAGG